jgi:hypothetical protein
MQQQQQRGSLAQSDKEMVVEAQWDHSEGNSSRKVVPWSNQIRRWMLKANETAVDTRLGV